MNAEDVKCCRPIEDEGYIHIDALHPETKVSVKQYILKVDKTRFVQC